MAKLVAKLQAQKGITITHEVVEKANHFYDKGMDDMIGQVSGYVSARMAALDGGGAGR